MTTDQADKNLLASLETKTIPEIVDMLFDTGGTAVTDPYALVFGTPAIIRKYKECFVTEIERRLFVAREESLLSVVKHLQTQGAL